MKVGWTVKAEWGLRQSFMVSKARAVALAVVEP
jgi:hypothetical protein